MTPSLLPLNTYLSLTKMKKTTLLFFLLLLPLMVQAQYDVTSPDGRIRVRLETVRRRNIKTKLLIKQRMLMNISVDGKRVLHRQEIGLDIKSHGQRYSFGKSDIIKYDVTETPAPFDDIGDSRLTQLGDTCKHMLLQTSTGIILEVIVFDQGVAYRFATTGYADEYKVLNVCNVFPGDKANAILGTFTGHQVFPWRVLNLEDARRPTMVEPDEWKLTYPSNKVVTWKDALSSVSIGCTFNWMAGQRWGEVSESSGIYGDFTYKYLYTGVSLTPCHELLYVYYDHDFPPFTKVIGSVRSWDVSARFGYNLPVQNGYDVWHFTPYVAATYLNLHQHGKTRIGYNDVTNNHHYLVGLGLKVQYMMRERVSLGVGYEHQLFTGRHEPKGRNTLLLTLGYCL